MLLSYFNPSFFSNWFQLNIKCESSYFSSFTHTFFVATGLFLVSFYIVRAKTRLLTSVEIILGERQTIFHDLSLPELKVRPKVSIFYQGKENNCFESTIDPMLGQILVHKSSFK